MSTREQSWVILLAGGDSVRLRGRTVRGLTLDRPKQFCRIASDRTLLCEALDRASRLVAPERIVPVVAASHRPWWTAELQGVPAGNVLEQPGNRGNAIAILHALNHILHAESDPLVVILPADHAVEDEDVLAEAIRVALRATLRARGRVVLLGIAPDEPDSEYGWIVPARATQDASAVRAFVEKPSRETAAELMRQGSLWNSFILASTGEGLLELFRATRPELLESYGRHLGSHETSARALESLFRELEPTDFSRDVLEHAPERLVVVRVPPCGWTDLGTPARLAAWVDRRGGGRPGAGADRGRTAADRERLAAEVQALV